MIKATFVGGLDDMSYLNFDGALIGQRNNFSGTVYVAPELRQDKFTIRNYLIKDFEAESINFPQSDVVFNLICNPERNFLVLRRLNFIIDQIKTPIINPPTGVLQSRRSNISSIAEGLDRLIVPRTIKAYLSNSQGLLELVDKKEISYPFLLRPIWTHGGAGLVKIEDATTIQKMKFSNQTFGLFYLSEFIDYKSKDGLYRKIRFFVVDGEIFPRHQIVGENWNVHMATRRERMLDNQELAGEEEKFLAKFTSKMGKKNIADIKKFSEKLGLDYYGVDGALADDGRFVIFEANAAMDAFRQGMRESFPYLDQYFERIRDAVEDLIVKRAAETTPKIQQQD